MSWRSEQKMKKGDFWILAAILLLAAVFWLIPGWNVSGERVRITAYGETKSYPLNRNRRIELGGENGELNIIVIEGSQVYMEQSSCKNQICVRHRAVSKNRESIICLPNEVYIEVESEDEKETDN